MELYYMGGGVNGVYIVFQDITESFRKKVYIALKIRQDTIGWKILTRVFTFLLIDFAWLFFRMENIQDAIAFLQKIVMEFRPSFFFSIQWFSIFKSIKIFCIVFSSVMILIVKDLLHYKKINVKKIILRQQLIIRWILYIAVILVILFWGAYGTDYEQTQFIYFQF